MARGSSGVPMELRYATYPTTSTQNVPKEGQKRGLRILKALDDCAPVPNDALLFT